MFLEKTRTVTDTTNHTAHTSATATKQPTSKIMQDSKKNLREHVVVASHSGSSYLLRQPDDLLPPCCSQAPHNIDISINNFALTIHAEISIQHSCIMGVTAHFVGVTNITGHLPISLKIP